ncbi:MAG: aminotransferase class V-fold PLP-dependent enzyme [Microthrixaceae bacterium]
MRCQGPWRTRCWRSRRASVFVDGSQLVGQGPSPMTLEGIDILATADHKFLMHAGRGLGYCYLSPRVQDRFVPVNAGWKAGRVPFESFYGPAMDLSGTASRFDNPLS